MGISNTIPPSRLIQPGVVANTAARPTSPFTGQAIYQVDTNQYLIWNGTEWTLPTNIPRGLVAYTNSTTTTISGGYLTGLNTTFTFLANRYYRISVGAQFAISGDIILEIHLDTTCVQRIFDSRFATRAAAFMNQQGMWVGTVAAGSKTAKLAVTLLSGTVTNGAASTTPNQLIIEDIGPA
jgi:hypothetical protein